MNPSVIRLTVCLLFSLLRDASSILFMDLAGFTKFSSSREPEDVFLLLETLYQSFDRIAAQKKVYKIETIGDCWVGVSLLSLIYIYIVFPLTRRACAFAFSQLYSTWNRSLFSITTGNRCPGNPA